MNIEWIVIRGSGFVAFALLAAATIWGLLLSTKLLGGAVKPKGLTQFHESLGLGALVATVVHMVALSVDDYIEFGVRELFVPGASAWRPLATALGVMAFYATVIVSLSFYAKRWIGQSRWRAIHYLGFGTFLSSLLHGIFAGSDRGHPVVLGIYVASLAVVIALLAVRSLTVDLTQGPTAIPQNTRRSESPDVNASS